MIADNDDYGKIKTLEKEKDNLSVQQMLFEKKEYNDKNKILNLTANLTRASETVVKLEKDFELLDKLFPLTKIFVEDPETKTKKEISTRIIDIKQYSFFIPGNTSKDVFKTFNNIVNDAIKNNKLNTTLFKYNDLEVVIRGTDKENYRINVKTPNNITYNYGYGQLVKNEETLINYPLNSLKKVENLIPTYYKTIKENNIQIEAINGSKGKEFSEDDKLRLEQIDIEISSLKESINKVSQEKFNKENNLDEEGNKKDDIDENENKDKNIEKDDIDENGNKGKNNGNNDDDNDDEKKGRNKGRSI